MGYIEKEYYENSFYQVDIQKRMNLIKAGIILQAIIFSISVSMNILFTIFYALLESDVFYYGFYQVYQIITIVLDYLFPVMAITTIVLFAKDFFKLSNFFTSEIRNKIIISAILFISYIAFAELALQIIEFFIRYRLFYYGIYTIVYFVIINIIRIGIISSAFLFMNQAIQKTYHQGLNRKTTLFSSYFVLATGVLFGIFYIFYVIFNLPYYSFTIFFSLFNIALVVGFIEIIIFLNRIQTESLRPPESTFYPGQVIYKKDQVLISSTPDSNNIGKLDTASEVPMGQTQITTEIIDGQQVQVIKQMVMIPPGTPKWKCTIQGSNKVWYEDFH
ncbi:MAG: hypothetical protein KGD59_04660 [Candidatus Heimdallarchaeota archaeon]|nr:hypothetical protein [Candidatus Heimdallarchaeota archaeon]MBY8993819.1 hypothetical protein [Candidatus Heimdallarchaeota archaeon]